MADDSESRHGWRKDLPSTPGPVKRFVNNTIRRGHTPEEMVYIKKWARQEEEMRERAEALAAHAIKALLSTPARA